MNGILEKTLAQQLGIDDQDIAFRKMLLGLTKANEEQLSRFSGAVDKCAQKVVDEFYEQQTLVPQITTIIGDANTLSRLKSKIRLYIRQLFSGRYDTEYVDTRLQVGRVHARIGVVPHLHISSMYRLFALVCEYLAEDETFEEVREPLMKLLMFDLQLAMDAYFQGLQNEINIRRTDVGEAIASRFSELHMTHSSRNMVDDAVLRKKYDAIVDRALNSVELSQVDSSSSNQG